MAEDWVYRLCLLGIVLSATTISIVHRRRARRLSDDPIDYCTEGVVIRWLIRFSAILLWLTTLGYLLWPPCVAWAQVSIPGAVRGLGAMLSLPSLCLMSWSLRALGTNLTDTVIVRRRGFLVVTGPYAWVRHPYYLAACGLILATTLLASNWAIGVSGVLLIGVLVYRLGAEESKLRERFGQAYEDYRRRTGAFFPRSSMVISKLYGVMSQNSE